LVLNGVRGGRVAFRSRPIRALSAETLPSGKEGEPPLLFTLERHLSPIDGEDGVRPYVYEIGPRGLIARWRGSALAWPLVDATVLPGDPPLLCALHRRDAFLELDVEAPADRVALYRWSGFGFTGAEQAKALEACRAVWKR
ncbi:MAG TPA: CapA family protein, partial [Thermoanaerobaculia bacterium]